MKHWVKGTIIALCGILLSSIPSVVNVNAATKPRTFSLDSAVLVGLDHSPKVKELFADYNLSAIEVERLETTAERGVGSPGVPGYRDTVAYELGQIKAKTLSALQAEATYLAAEATLRQELHQHVSEVKNAFLAVVKAKEARSLAGQQVERAKRQENQAKISFEAGTVAQVDYEQAQSNRKSAELQLANADSALEVSLLDLKQLIGYQVEDDVEVEGTVKFEPIANLNYQSDLEQTLQTSPSLIQVKLQRDVAKKTMELEDPYLPSSAIGYRENAANLQKAELQLQQATQSVAFQLKKLHLQLQQLQNQIAVHDEIVAQAQRSLEVSEARYRAGMATTLDIMQAQLNLQQAELERLDTTFAYMNAVENRNVLIGAENNRVESFIEKQLADQ